MKLDYSVEMIEFLQNALECFVENNQKEAEKHYYAINTMLGGHPYSLFMLARINFDKALAQRQERERNVFAGLSIYYLQDALEIDPTFRIAHDLLAKVYTMLGDLDKAAHHQDLVGRTKTYSPYKLRVVTKRVGRDIKKEVTPT